MSPEFKTYLQGLSITVFTAIEFSLPTATVRLLDGSAELTFEGMTFVGKDPTYGALLGVEELEEALGTEAPRARCLIGPPDEAAIALWTAPNVQESEIKIWMGGVDSATGTVIVSPELEYVGEIDVPIIRFGQNEQVLEIDIASAWERMFAVDEGHKLNDAFHQSIYPGEKGMEFTTGVQRNLYWGGNTPAAGGSPTRSDIPRGWAQVIAAKEKAAQQFGQWNR